jgi:molecular chaperone GrpE
MRKMPIPPTTQDENPAEGEPAVDAAQRQGDAHAKEIAAAVQEVAVEAGLADELAAERDRVLRLQAEMENLRNRTLREINEERRYAPLPIVRDLLPAIDNIDRAIEAAEQSGEASGLLEGFKLVRQQLVSLLEQHNCKRIEDVGERFDPQVHEAILQQPSGEQPAGHILLVTEVGYLLHDRVVRPSKVIISSGPTAPAQ